MFYRINQQGYWLQKLIQAMENASPCFFPGFGNQQLFYTIKKHMQAHSKGFSYIVEIKYLHEK